MFNFNDCEEIASATEMGAIERIGHSIAVVSSVLTFVLLAILFIGPNLPFWSPSLCFFKVGGRNHDYE